MQFAGIDNPFGTAAFEPVVWPMPELQNKKLMREVKRSIRVSRAPKPPSQILKNFLLTYNK